MQIVTGFNKEKYLLSWIKCALTKFQMFVGNDNDSDEKRITLIYPIIARYVRFNPQRWNMVISLRVDVTGCPYRKF